MISVSVIIPVYNSEKYITNALNSAITQTLTNIEIICVDDGSADHSKDIIGEYCQSDSRIIYVFQENSGPGVARNLGMQYATGEYIAFLDSDDEYPGTNALQLLYTKAKENDTHICGGSVCGEKWTNQTDAVFSTEGFRRFADYQNDYMFWRFIYRRKFLEERKIKFPGYRIYEDPVFLLEVMDSAQCFYAITECVYKKNEGHLSNEKKSLVEIKQRLAGIETNIRLATQKEYCAIIQRNISALCNLTDRISELICEQVVDEELYEQLMRIIPLVSIKNSSTAKQISLSYRISVLLQVILVLSFQKKKMNHSIYLVYKYLHFSIINNCLKLKNKTILIVQRVRSIWKMEK